MAKTPAKNPFAKSGTPGKAPMPKGGKPSGQFGLKKTGAKTTKGGKAC